MSQSREENLTTKYLPWSIALITLFVSTNLGGDPVNLPKLTLLTLLIALFLGLNYKKFFRLQIENKPLGLIFLFFFLGLFVNLFTSTSNLHDEFYGAFGRNTGFLAYFFLAILALIASNIRNIKFHGNLLNAFFVAGFANLLYGLYFTIFHKDIFAWSNIFKSFLGTVGNPDFASALLGMYFAVSLVILISNCNKYFRIIAALSLPFSVFVIHKTGALQGLVIVAIGICFILIYLLSKKLARPKITFVAIFTISIGMIFAVLGMLQIGPFTSFLYKPSVSIRGAYWRAALRMFETHPISGVGMSSYGDWYRRVRDGNAIKVPGLSVSTDTAHNVFLDFLSGGGILLFIPYIALVVYVSIKSITILRKSTFNPVILGISIIWFTYLAQSFISINQIGLAVWGWISAGAILGFEKAIVIEDFKKNKSAKPNQWNEVVSAKTYIVTLVCLFAAIALIVPKQISEANYRSALKSKDLNKIMKATDAWPRNCGRYIMTYNALAGTQYFDQALNVVSKCYNLNNNNYQAVQLLTQFDLAADAKLQIKKQLHKLDPLNPAYK